MAVIQTVIPWLLNRILDYTFPPLALFALLVWAPLVATWNIGRQLLRSFFAPSLSGKVVMITGASSGIGEHVAYEYARRNSQLFLVARRTEKLTAVANHCIRLGSPMVEYVEADLGTKAGCKTAVEQAIAKFGKLDILVLNAGVGQAYLFEHAENVEVLQETINIDFWGYVYTTIYALPYLKSAKGKIIVNSSIAGLTPFARHSIYGAAKAMVAQFFDTLRVEIRDEVKITIVFPGPIASELAAGKVLKEHGRMEIDQERRDELLGPQPMVDTSTCARTMVDCSNVEKRYRIIPSWEFMQVLYRIFVPEILFLMLWLGQMSHKPGEPVSTKKNLDQIGGQKWLYKPPTQSKEQAKEAVESTKESTKEGGGTKTEVVGTTRETVAKKTT